MNKERLLVLLISNPWREELWLVGHREERCSGEIGCDWLVDLRIVGLEMRREDARSRKGDTMLRFVVRSCSVDMIHIHTDITLPTGVCG
jgi:hypothetical protein